MAAKRDETRRRRLLTLIEDSAKGENRLAGPRGGDRARKSAWMNKIGGGLDQGTRVRYLAETISLPSGALGPGDWTSRTDKRKPPDPDGPAPNGTRWIGRHDGRKTHNPQAGGSSPPRPTVSTGRRPFSPGGTWMTGWPRELSSADPRRPAHLGSAATASGLERGRSGAARAKKPPGETECADRFARTRIRA